MVAGKQGRKGDGNREARFNKGDREGEQGQGTVSGGRRG